MSLTIFLIVDCLLSAKLNAVKYSERKKIRYMVDENETKKLVIAKNLLGHEFYLQLRFF